jgi:hypothetical protein
VTAIDLWPVLILKELIDEREQEIILDTIDEHHTEFESGDTPRNHETLKNLIEKAFNDQIVRKSNAQIHITDPRKAELLKNEIKKLEDKKQKTLDELETNQMHYRDEINRKLEIYKAARLIDTI